MESLSDFPTHLLEKVLLHSSFNTGKSLLCTCTSINNRKNEIKWLPIIQNAKNTFDVKNLQVFNDFHRSNFTKEFDAYLYGGLKYLRNRYRNDSNIINRVISDNKYSSCHYKDGIVAIVYYFNFRNYGLNRRYVFGPYTQIIGYSNYLLGIRPDGKIIILYEDRDYLHCDAILSKQFLDIKASLFHVNEGQLGLTCLSLDGKIYKYGINSYETQTKIITLDGKTTTLKNYKCISFVIGFRNSYFLFDNGAVTYEQGNSLKQISLSEKCVRIMGLQKGLLIHLESGKKIIFTWEDHEKDRISYLKDIPCNW